MTELMDTFLEVLYWAEALERERASAPILVHPDDLDLCRRLMPSQKWQAWEMMPDLEG